MSSSIRCRGPWKINKRISESDRWLDEMGFFRKHIAKDASCLFRAVSENVYNTQRYYHNVRLECVHFMATMRHHFDRSLPSPFENYLKEMSNPTESGGFLEITAMSHLYRRDFIIFEANKGPQTKIGYGYGNTIYLFHSLETKHFDVVYTKEFVNASSFCQSMVYEILYGGVYQLKDLSYAVDKMLHYAPGSHIEYIVTENVDPPKKPKEQADIVFETVEDSNNNAVALKCKHHTGNTEKASLLKESLSIFVFNRSLIQLENVCMNCLNVNSAKDLLDNGITPLPYKVAKALDPDIFRNIEFDVWSEMRRELRFGARYSDGTTLQVGVKCLCKLYANQSPPYRCHIQEMRPDGGPCMVFIEELGEKRIVNYDQLQPLPLSEARPWAPPYRYSRTYSQIVTLNQVLQQIGITRKHGVARVRKIRAPEESPEKPLSQSWSEMAEAELTTNTDLDQEIDFDHELAPVEVTYPAMVDIRPGAGAPPEPPPAAPNGGPPHSAPQDNHHSVNNQVCVSDVALAGSPAPQAPPAPTITTYAGGPVMTPMGGACGGYYYGGGGARGVLWAPPPAAAAYKSVQPNGADLPMNDIPTLRYYYNLGVEWAWACGAPPPPPPRPCPPPALAQEMQQMSLGAHDKGKDNKPPPNHNNYNKNNGQRTLLPPRFNKRGNQEGNQPPNNQNKPHNNNTLNNKPPNNRRNSHDARGPYEDCPPTPPLVTPMPYMYPPPVYPVHYYPLDPDPGMLGMGMNMGMGGYVNYEEGPGEYMGPYYPPLYPAPPAHPAMPPPHHNITPHEGHK